MRATFDRKAMLRRARERGGIASMIVCAISNDARNSDLRADNPTILKAFNDRFELMESALRTAESFIADELKCRTKSYLPHPTKEESDEIGVAQDALDAVRAAIGKADPHTCGTCGGPLVDIAGPSLTAKLCPVCDADSSAFGDGE